MKMLKKTMTLLLSIAMVASAVACGVPTAAPASPSTTAPASSAADKGTTAPAAGEEVILRVVDWSDSSLAMRKEFNKKFEEKNPGVKVEYTMLTVDQFKNTIITMIKSGDGPDLFPIPVGMTLSTALKEDWYQSMSPYLTQEFKDTLEDFVWQEGVTTFEGEVYNLPEITPLTNVLFYYNKDVLEKAGVTTLPQSYDEFVAVCKQVSEAGKGQFYGMIEGGKQMGRIDAMVRGMAALSGGEVPESSSKALTVGGAAPLDVVEIQEALGMLDSLAKSGGLHPDSVNYSAPEAREMFAQGQAAFLCQGMWCIPPWSANYPDLNYGVMAPPTKDGTVKGALHTPDLGPWLGIYKQSKNPELAAKYLMALFSEEYGFQSSCVTAGNGISIVKGINEKYISNPVMKEYYEVAKQNMKTVPVAAQRDAKVYDMYANVKDVAPSLGAIGQGVMAQSIPDYIAALHKLAADTTAEWKRAAEAVGLDFAMLDFPNWDISKDYTEADYKALE